MSHRTELVLLAALMIPVSGLQAQNDTAGDSFQESAAEAPAPEGQPPSLEQAYQREFAFLQGQKRDLEQRLARARDTGRAERDRLEEQIRRLEREVVEMDARADRLEDRVFEAERGVQAARDNTDLLAATFTQADFTLGDAWSDTAGATGAPGAEEVRALFAAAAGVLEQAGRVRATPGEFFLTDGTRVSGQLLRLGNIAAYGISDRGTGALAPAGDGEFKIWESASANAALALAAGEAPSPLPVFLFETLNNEVERKVAKGVFETVSTGGVIGWIIFALGLLALILILLRSLFLSRASAATGRIMGSVGEHVRRGERDAALDALKKHKGATARVVAAAIRNLDREREHLEDIVSEAILHERGHLNRFGAFIIVIAAVSPLLGLLGTVTGMISTFDVITEFGTGDPKLLSGGISIALVTTELGLIVAIPTLLMGNLLSGWAERITDDMEKAALRVINQFTERGAEPAGEHG